MVTLDLSDRSAYRLIGVSGVTDAHLHMWCTFPQFEYVFYKCDNKAGS